MSSLDNSLSSDVTSADALPSTGGDATRAGINHGYWMSLSEVDPEAAPTPSDVEGADGDVVDPLNRRNFMQLMGASMALAGVAGAGCHRYDREEIVPLSRRRRRGGRRRR